MVIVIDDDDNAQSVIVFITFLFSLSLPLTKTSLVIVCPKLYYDNGCSLRSKPTVYLYWSRRGPSSISVPNLKRIAQLVQKLLWGFRN